MNENANYQKQLTLQERYVIEDGLNHVEGIASIARRLGKDITTISREVRKHRIGDEGLVQNIMIACIGFIAKNNHYVMNVPRLRGVALAR